MEVDQEVKIKEIRDELEKFSSPLEKLLFLEIKSKELKGDALKEIQNEIQSLIDEIASQASSQGAMQIGEVGEIARFSEEDFRSPLPTKPEEESLEEIGGIDEIDRARRGREMSSYERREEKSTYLARLQERIERGEGIERFFGEHAYLSPFSIEREAESQLEIEERPRQIGIAEELKIEPEIFKPPSTIEELERPRREEEAPGLRRELKGYLRKIGEL